MALRTQPTQARAVGAFNPTAPQPGFLQPLLVGLGGDNRTYVQAFESPDRISSFVEVTWPDRDFVQLSDEFFLLVDGPALWAFQFPGEPPLVEFWTEFRTSLSARIADHKLADHPLLQFDIVDTLDLDEAKPEVFTRAYRVYAAMGSEAANRWRDRSILEPAIARRLNQLDLRPDLTRRTRQGRKQLIEDFPWLRARVTDSHVEIQTLELNKIQERAVQQAYYDLASQLPEIFIKNADVVFRAPVHRLAPPSPKTSHLGVVLIGRINQSFTPHNQWLGRGIYVFDEAQFRAQVSNKESAYQVTILIGSQSDWRSLVEIGKQIDPNNGLIITLSTSASPLVRDLEFQAETNLRTLSFFAPYLTSTFGARDPLQALEPIFEILLDITRRVGQQALQHFLPKQHNILMREPITSGQTPIEVSYRLGARAMRAGVVLDGPARMYVLGDKNFPFETALSVLEKLFLIADFNQVDLPTRRPVLLLFAERSSGLDLGMRVGQQRKGVLRLLECMGWSIYRETERGAQIGALDRQFEIAIIDDTGALPPETPGAPAPGLTRAPLLIVHCFARRDTLLSGNRGQYFHMAIEDIALMNPDRPWVWAVVKRQLFEGNSRHTQAALRLSTVLVAEAIQQQRIIDPSSVGIDWRQVNRLLQDKNSERFFRFTSEKVVRGRLSIVSYGEALPHEVVIDLYIGVSGPVIQAVIENRLPLE